MTEAESTKRVEWWGLGHPAWPSGITFTSLADAQRWFFGDGRFAYQHGVPIIPEVTLQERVIIIADVTPPAPRPTLAEHPAYRTSVLREPMPTFWQADCSCGKWLSRQRDERSEVNAEAMLHDDAPYGRHVTRIREFEGVPQ